MVRNTRISNFLTALVLASQISATSALAGSCWTSGEVHAYQVRGLQTMLMVASLKCTAMGGTATSESYNHFVKVIRPALGTSASLLMARFKKLYGTQAQSAMDSTVTQLANQFSASEISDNICIEATDMAEQTAAHPETLETLAATRVALPENAVVCENQ